MSPNSNKNHPSSPLSDPSSPVRRPHAPTITIDTSAVSTPPLPSQTHHETQQQQSSASSEQSSSLSPHHANPFQSHSDNKSSSPTSPHNASATPSDSRSNYLAVPGKGRSDSASSPSDTEHPDTPGNSSYGGDTCVGSPNERDHHDLMSDPEALTPDPQNEADFHVDNNKFAFSPGQLNKLLNPKSLSAFYALGGLDGLEKGLRTNRKSGLGLDETVLEGEVTFKDATASSSAKGSSRTDHNGPTSPGSSVDPASSFDAPDDTDRIVQKRSSSSSSSQSPNPEDIAFYDRKRVYSDNRLPERKAKSIWVLAWEAYNDKMLILLSVAAVISLALGIYQSVTAEGGEAKVQWVEGVAIMVAILIVVAVGAVNDYQKERQFVKLNKKKEDRLVKVTRSGKEMEISTHDVLVGDVVHLDAGDIIPVDGVFISGHNVKCDESSATGESDLKSKTAAADVYQAIENKQPLKKLDPFILSGARVSEGIGTFVVTAIGVNSTHGKTIMSLQDDTQTTPLQLKLNVLSEQIAKLGLAAGLVLFVVLFIKFLATLHKLEGSAAKGQSFLQIFIVSVTIIVVAVPEGLPLAVTLALAFATTRMLKDNNLVRVLRACETMGNATTICSDKTGTLTQNVMTVVRGTIGTESRFSRSLGTSNDASASNDANDGGNGDDSQNQRRPSPIDAKEVPTTECVNSWSISVKELIMQSIVHNSTAFESEKDDSATFIGSKTECALLGLARDHLGLGPLAEARENCEVLQMVPFDSQRKCMGVVIRLSNGKARLLVKGASEILLRACNSVIHDVRSDLSITELTDERRESLSHVQHQYASHSLRNIALVYKDFDNWPPEGAPKASDDNNQVQFDAIFKDMNLVSIFGIQDPLRQGVLEAVRTCQNASVFVRMVTGDNIETAKAIGQESGVFTAGGIAMEGPKFRKLNQRQLQQVIPRLQVLARSSPEDKRILVSELKKMGETVAVTGDGTNDAPALKMADVGFSMGIAGTEVAKEASAIILMDDNFNSIIKAMAWGRTVNDAVRKFLQFQITVNITAVIVTFVSAVSSNKEESVLTAVQLLWVNLIMDTFAALALATDPPTPTILDRKPDPKSAPLISLSMWKMIIGQAIYQLIVTFVLNFAGQSIMGYGPDQEKEYKTLVFNAFVWMQIFNQYNCRRIDNELNILEGLTQNKWFIGIQFIIIGGQILIVFVGGHAFSVTRINGVAWAVSVIIGLLSLPIGMIVRFVPDELLVKIAHPFRRKSKSPQLVVEDEHGSELDQMMADIRAQLMFMKTVRGGRLRNLKYKLQHPSALLPLSRSSSPARRGHGDEESIPPPSPSSPSAAPPSPSPSHPRSPSHQPATPDSHPTSDGKRPRGNSATSALSARSGSHQRTSLSNATIASGLAMGGLAGLHKPKPNNSKDAAFPIPASGHAQEDLGRAGIDVHPNTNEDDPVLASEDSAMRCSMPPSQNPELAPQLIYSRSPTSNNEFWSSRP